MTPANLITGLFLFLSSAKDLSRRKGLKDKTYIAAIILTAGSFLVTHGPGTAGASIMQALIGMLFGFFMRLFTKFGGADIWTLALIAASFPNTIILRILAYIFIPYVIWLKTYSLTGRDTAPAIPGLSLGFLLAVSAL